MLLPVAMRLASSRHDLPLEAAMLWPRAHILGNLLLQNLGSRTTLGCKLLHEEP